MHERHVIHCTIRLSVLFFHKPQPADRIGKHELVGLQPLTCRADYRPHMNPSLELLVKSYRHEVADLRGTTSEVVASHSDLSTQISNAYDLVKESMGCAQRIFTELTQGIDKNAGSITSLRSTVSELQQCSKEATKHLKFVVECLLKQEEQIASQKEAAFQEKLERLLAERQRNFEERMDQHFANQEKLLQAKMESALDERKRLLEEQMNEHFSEKEKILQERMDSVLTENLLLKLRQHLSLNREELFNAQSLDTSSIRTIPEVENQGNPSRRDMKKRRLRRTQSLTCNLPPRQMPRQSPSNVDAAETRQAVLGPQRSHIRCYSAGCVRSRSANQLQNTNLTRDV